MDTYPKDEGNAPSGMPDDALPSATASAGSHTSRKFTPTLARSYFRCIHLSGL